MLSSLPPAAFAGRFRSSEVRGIKQAEGRSSQSVFVTDKSRVNITYYAKHVKRFGKVSSSPAERVSIR